MPRASRLSSPVRPCGDGDVEDLAQQERRGDRDQRGGADQQADEREPPAVGAEEPQDPAQLGRLPLGGFDVFGRRGPLCGVAVQWAPLKVGNG